MGILSNTIIRSLLGILLLCVFSLRPCAALVRNVSVLKNLASMEKGIEDPSKEGKESKEQKDRASAEYEAPATALQPATSLRGGSPRQRVRHEALGCPGPVLQIPTPPPACKAPA